MVGLVITGLGVMAVLALLTQTFRVIRPIREHTSASLLAQSEMERLRADAAAIGALGSQTTLTTNDIPQLAEFSSPTAVIYKTLYTNFYSAEPIYSVAIEISWQLQNGDRATNVLSSIIYQNGVGRP